jgi:hypothetical protein
MPTNQPGRLARTNKRGPQGEPIYDPPIGPVHKGTNQPIAGPVSPNQQSNIRYQGGDRVTAALRRGPSRARRKRRRV